MQLLYLSMLCGFKPKKVVFRQVVINRSVLVSPKFNYCVHSKISHKFGKEIVLLYLYYLYYILSKVLL